MQKVLIKPQNKELELILKFYFYLGKCGFNLCYSKNEFTNYQKVVLLFYYIKENKSLREFYKLKSNTLAVDEIDLETE